ncbi:DUF7523 family protein [Haloplanus aerogenes]|uniref:Uncharacterized protein n=1 Tax=Haloplanus aerogenes TaxID=660522 RepID=A0A3M0DZ32_9EURY|nr:hypothetical protein [Haloplanus aerogenes]AZH25503.1 hypothetical protein DU502_08960 [Haloplanus aerogenes]RMB25216.1 hypothetical protein ATH50_0300 [Haloplanus aerogenes]
MSIAERTREAVRERPFLLDALRAGVVNYRAAATMLELDANEESVAAALRRFAADLPDYSPSERSVRVTVERGVGIEAVDDTDHLLVVGGQGVYADAGSFTALLGTGEVDARALATALDRLAAVGIDVEAAGVAGDHVLVVVDGRSGGRALRVLESAFGAVPDPA